MTDEEIRARLGDAMDGLTKAWSSIEAILVELRDRELRGAAVRHPANGPVTRDVMPAEAAARIMERTTLERYNKRFGHVPSIEERPY